MSKGQVDGDVTGGGRSGDRLLPSAECQSYHVGAGNHLLWRDQQATTDGSASNGPARCGPGRSGSHSWFSGSFHRPKL